MGDVERVVEVLQPEVDVVDFAPVHTLELQDVTQSTGRALPQIGRHVAASGSISKSTGRDTHDHSRSLHGNEVDRDRADMWEISYNVKHPGDMEVRHSAFAGIGRTYQLPLPHPRSRAAFVTPGVSSARISGSGGGYLPMTSMNMMC